MTGSLTETTLKQSPPLLFKHRGCRENIADVRWLPWLLDLHRSETRETTCSHLGPSKSYVVWGRESLDSGLEALHSAKHPELDSVNQ